MTPAQTDALTRQAAQLADRNHHRASWLLQGMIDRTAGAVPGGPEHSNARNPMQWALGWGYSAGDATAQEIVEAFAGHTGIALDLP